MFFVRLGASQNIMGALYKGLIATGVISIALIAVLTHLVFGFDAVFTGTNVTRHCRAACSGARPSASR